MHVLHQRSVAKLHDLLGRHERRRHIPRLGLCQPKHREWRSITPWHPIVTQQNKTWSEQASARAWQRS